VKLLVETLGNYGLYDLYGQQEVRPNRPTVVTRTPFIDVNRGAKLTVLEELADDASDEALAAATSDEELEAAIAALPRAKKPAPAPAAKKDPLDHDGDGRKGGSLPKSKR
jgi:hypothetical protein